MSGLVASSKGSGAGYQNPPAGVHLARCIELIDLGTQTPDNPQYNPSRKLQIRWELPITKYEIKDEQGNVTDSKPFIVSGEYTLSLGDKSKLKPMLESWRGQAFTKEELDSFDVTKLLDIPCQINLMEKVAKTSGNTYMIVSAVMPITVGTVVPDRFYDLKRFDVDNFDQVIFDSLSEFVQKKIKASDEYNLGESADAAQPTEQTTQAAQKPAEAHPDTQPTTAQPPVEQPPAAAELDLGPPTDLEQKGATEKAQDAAAASQPGVGKKEEPEIKTDLPF